MDESLTPAEITLSLINDFKKSVEEQLEAYFVE
jgi:hypothetical protein